MRLERVSHPDDPRLRDFARLTDVQLRRRIEPAQGLFIAEGEKVIRRAVAAGYAVRSVLCEQRWVEPLGDVLQAVGATVLVADPEVLTGVTGYPVHRGALAAMARRPLPEPAELLATADRVAVIEDVVDHTNVGAIFRAAAALGVDAVLLSPRCADPLYRRAVKVSMGAVFSVPYARFGQWPQGLDELRGAGLRVLALTPAPGAEALTDVAGGGLGRWAVLFGAEGEGLSRWALEAADSRVRIPMSHGVDSLNVAAAAAVVFYALGPGGHPSQLPQGPPGRSPASSSSVRRRHPAPPA